MRASRAWARRGAGLDTWACSVGRTGCRLDQVCIGAQPGTLGCRPGLQAWVAGLVCRRAAHLFAHARLAARACAEVDGCLLGRRVREQLSRLLRDARELFERELACGAVGLVVVG